MRLSSRKPRSALQSGQPFVAQPSAKRPGPPKTAAERAAAPAATTISAARPALQAVDTIEATAEPAGWAEYTALHTFEGQVGEVSITRGERLLVSSETAPKGWILAARVSNPNVVGYVPLAYCAARSSVSAGDLSRRSSLDGSVACLQVQKVPAAGFAAQTPEAEVRRPAAERLQRAKLQRAREQLDAERMRCEVAIAKTEAAAEVVSVAVYFNHRANLVSSAQAVVNKRLCKREPTRAQRSTCKEKECGGILSESFLRI